MNQDVFFKNFELLADAPNGIQKLRELILQLAVMGKLVPQDPNDEPASVLIEKIKGEKRNNNGKKIKKSDSSSTIVEDEIIFKIPEGWKFDRLGNIAQTITKGSTPTSYGYYFQEEGIRFVKVENVKNGRIVIENIKDFISEEAHEFQSRSKLESGDILFSIAGTIGETCVVQDQDLPANTNQALAIIRGTNTVFDSNYLKVQFDSFVSNAVKSKARGGAMNNVSLGDLKDLVVFIPPLAEQKRIVAKVDELMALCDKLEARRQKKQEIQSKLNSVALERMLSAENQDEFEQYWQRIRENFDLLYDNPENVEKLRQAILQLAVQGKLVEQNPKDEPASVLIEKIEAEKKRYAKEYNLREKEPLPPVEADEEIFQLPAEWIWSRIGSSFLTSSGTTPKRSNHDYFIGGTENWVKTTDLTNGIVTSCEEKITPEAVNDCNLKYYPVGTVCVAMYGGAGTIGKSGILGMESTINQSVCGIYPNKYFLPEFLHCYIKSIRSEWMKFAAGLRKDPNINGKIIDRMVVPIPPLAEQKRIVEKVEQFMELCDKLESKLRKSREDSEKLMEAVVKGLLEDAAAEKTELEKPIPLQVATVQLK